MRRQRLGMLFALVAVVAHAGCDSALTPTSPTASVRFQSRCSRSRGSSRSEPRPASNPSRARRCGRRAFRYEPRRTPTARIVWHAFHQASGFSR